MRVRLGDYIKEYSERNKQDSNIPVYSVTNSQGFVSEYFYKEVASKDKTTYKLVPRGYFAYNPSRINVGSVDFQRKEDCVIVSPLYVVFHVSNELDKNYLLYYLKSQPTLCQIKHVATGSVRDNLKFSYLADFNIELKPIEEQKTIVKTLQHIETLIVLYKKQLSKLDELVKCRFVELFGDPMHNTHHLPTAKLKELCHIGSSKRIYQNETTQSGIPFLKISDFVKLIDSGLENCETFITLEKYNELCSKGLVPKSGDILISSRGTIGKCYIVKEKDIFYFQDGMISWLSNISDRVSSLFISYLFSMNGLQKQIDNLLAGSTVAYLSLTMLQKLDIIIPPIEEQHKFSSFVQQIDKLRFKYHFFVQQVGMSLL